MFSDKKQWKLLLTFFSVSLFIFSMWNYIWNCGKNIHFYYQHFLILMPAENSNVFVYWITISTFLKIERAQSWISDHWISIICISIMKILYFVVLKWELHLSKIESSGGFWNKKKFYVLRTGFKFYKINLLIYL